MTPSLEPIVFEHTKELFERLAAELQALATESEAQLVCLATGSTFADFYRSLNGDSECLQAPCVFTHLDEYAGFQVDTPGGMAWELQQELPALQGLQQRGRFFPFPNDASALGAHASRIQALGGVALQFLGIGRNGHLAFNEPGSDPDASFHGVQLHPWTIEDMGARFGAAPTPTGALTSGLADILAARRIVFVARGAGKAEAVRRMLQEPPHVDCPASHLQGHPNVILLLDRAAASRL